MTKKYFDMIGLDRAAIAGEELTDVYDTEKVVAARTAYDTMVQSYEASEPQEQDAVEFYMPDEEYLDWFLTGEGRGSLIPGVRFPKVGDFFEQSVNSFITVPANVALERQRLGGSLFSNPFSSFDASDAEVDAVIKKYNIDTFDSQSYKLLDAESAEDLEARAIVIARRQERARQIAVDNPGLLGIAGQVGMSVLDPTMWITGGLATAKLTSAVLNSSTKTGAALRFAQDGLTKGEKFKIGAASYLAAEAPIELANATQEAYFDPAMTLAFMAVAPLVGGAFNTLGRADNVDSDLMKGAIALDEAIAKGIQGSDSGAVGAAQRGPVPMTVDEDGLPGAPPRASGWTFGTPLNFLARSADPLVRSVADRLSWNSNTRSTQGTTAAEAQRRTYNALSVVVRDLRMSAKEYFGAGVVSPNSEQLEEFFRAVGKHRARVLTSDNPAIIRAANALDKKYGEALAYVKDPNWLPGMDLPVDPASPAAPGAPPAASSAAPNAPTPPPATPPSAAPVASPEAPGSITQAAPDAPEPISAPDAPTAASAAPETVAPAPDATGINPEAPKGTARDYFGRKSFRSGSSETVPPKSDIAPEGATSRVPDEGIVEAPKPTDRTPPTIKTVDEKIAQVKAATRQVIEAAPEGPPSRTDLRRALQGYVEAAEAIAFARPDANTAILDAAAQMRRYIQGSSAGTNKTFYAKYLDGLQRLTNALEDVDDDAADKLLATVIDDLDNGFGSKLSAEPNKDEGLLASRRGSAEDAARLERGRAMGFDVDNPVYRGLWRPYSEQEARNSPQWFTSSPEDAADYVNAGGDGGNVIEAYIRRGNNARIEAGGAFGTRIPSAAIPEELLAGLRRKEAGPNAGQLYDTYSTDEIVRAAQAAGFDSVTFKDVLDPAATGSVRVDGSEASPATVEVVFRPSNIRATWADFKNGTGDLLASRAGGLERAAEAEQVRAANAEIYDAVQAAFSFGQGPYKKPSIGTTAAVGGAGAAAAAAAVAIYEDAPDEVKAGITALAAGIGLAAGAAVGKGRVRKWEKNTPSLGIFAGPTAKGVSLKDLQKAQKMEKAGTGRDVIWKETGWGRMGPAGEWLTEIRDPMAGLNDMLTDLKVRLGDVLDAPKIMRAYADLYEVRMQTGEMLRYIYDTNADGAANLSAKTLAVRMDVNRAEQLRIAIHEINHLIQGQRKRQVPGATEMDARAAAAEAEMNKLLAEYDMWYEDLQQWPQGYKGPEKQETLDRMDELAQQIDELNPASKEYYQYLTLDLEAESRLVETRLGMTAQQARERPPWYDLDVEENDLWMARQVGRYAASLGSDLKAFRDDAWWNSNVTEGTFGPESELNGQRYWKNDQVHAWVEDVGDGEGSFNWDWNENIESGQLFEDNPNASPAQSARAFAFAQVALERTLKTGEFTVVTFEGLKKPKPGQDMSGHERVQEFLMGRGNTDGYVATKGSWKLKLKGQETTRSSFAFIREGMDIEETWKGIRQGKVDIKIVEKAPKKENLMASRGPTGPRQEAPQAAPEPDDGYRGLDEWKDIAFDPGYYNVSFNQQGFERIISSPEFRNNPDKLGNRFGDILLRSDPERYEELAQRLNITAQEAAWRTGRKYIDTVTKLMNPARGAGTGVEKPKRINPADREAAKEIVREMLNDGSEFDALSEDALELILDIVAPARKQNAESPRARPRLKYQLNQELDGDIVDMFEWNAEKLFVSYARHMSGYAGILRAGYRSVAELNQQIAQIEANADFDPQRKKRAEREAKTLAMTRDAILGVPAPESMASPEFTFVANQLRRLNFGNLMSNTGFLAMSEVAGAMTQVSLVKMFKMFPEYQRYISRARAGDPRAQESIYYMADAMMGHGSAQLRSRVGSIEDRATGEAPSLEVPLQGAQDRFDRFTRKQANLTARFSGMSPIQEFLRMTVVTAEAQTWVKAARNGKPPYSARRMAAAGVDAAMWQRVSTELRRWGDVGSPDTRRMVPNMDVNSWADKEALNAFINALDRNANRVVMEGDIGHTAFWLRNNPAASLFFQFLNFPLNAFSKHLGYALNTRDTRAGAEMLAMSIGGGAGYVARTLAQANAQDTEEEKQKILDERLNNAEIAKALVYYSAHGSILPNAVDLLLHGAEMAKIPNPIPGYEDDHIKTLFDKSRASGLPGNPITGNPTINRANQLPQVAGNLANGTPFSEQDVQRAISFAAPLGNHIALTAFLDRALEFLPDEEGSIEAEVQQ